MEGRTWKEEGGSVNQNSPNVWPSLMLPKLEKVSTSMLLSIECTDPSPKVKLTRLPACQLLKPKAIWLNRELIVDEDKVASTESGVL